MLIKFKINSKNWLNLNKKKLILFTAILIGQVILIKFRKD